MKKIIDALYALALMISLPLIMLADLNRTPTSTPNVVNIIGVANNHFAPGLQSAMNTTSLIVKKPNY